MGKKKNRKRRAAEAARRREERVSSPLTVLQGIGDAVLDQLRSPAGRQVIAAALIAAAGAISRGGVATSPTAKPRPEDQDERDMSTAPASPSIPADMSKIAGVALNAFDNWLAHKTRN